MNRRSFITAAVPGLAAAQPIRRISQEQERPASWMWMLGNDWNPKVPAEPARYVGAWVYVDARHSAAKWLRAIVSTDRGVFIGGPIANEPTAPDVQYNALLWVPICPAGEAFRVTGIEISSVLASAADPVPAVRYEGLT